MHNLKFCNKLLSLVNLTYKQNHVWFDIVITNKILLLIHIFNKIGLISNFIIIKKNFKKICRVFLKYINLETFHMLPFFFYFKPSHKLTISLQTIKKLSKNFGSSVLIVSTSKGLKTLDECLILNTGGVIFLIIYI